MICKNLWAMEKAKLGKPIRQGWFFNTYIKEGLIEVKRKSHIMSNWKDACNFAKNSPVYAANKKYVEILIMRLNKVLKANYNIVWRLTLVMLCGKMKSHKIRHKVLLPGEWSCRW